MNPFELEKYVIVIISLAGVVAEIYTAWRLRKKTYAWMFWGTAIVLLFWAIYYFDSLFNVHDNTHQIWVRTGITLTIGLIDAGILNTIGRLK